MSSQLRRKLEAGQFVVTGELAPPKGTDVTRLIDHARLLRGKVDAVNITDNQRSIMKLTSLASCVILKQEGVEPVMQVACRDRNRLALQSDLLSAHVLGIPNILALTGDPIHTGDHKTAKPVFDWNSIELIRAIAQLNQGFDSEGHPLTGKTDLFIGGAINPCAGDLDAQLRRLEKKIAAGVQFIQTQAIYDMTKFKKFIERARPFKVYILGGILLLKSAKMARFLNKSVPGIAVPDALIAEMEKAADPMAKGIEIAARQIAQCRSLAHGVHLMTVGAEEKIVDILETEKRGLRPLRR